jgi:hypothetical protein
MKANSMKKAAVLVAVAVVLAFASQASADTSHQRVDRLAFRLLKQTKDVQEEVNTHFRRTPQYRHLASDVADMVRLARHIHEVAHDGGSLRHLRADVQKLDKLFHHVEELVDELARSRQTDRQTIRHIREELREMHNSLSDLRRELR